MKKILLATDFSKASTQAMNYVIEIARKTGAEISLLNAYLVPAVEFTGNMSTYTAMSQDEKVHAERQLKDIIHLISNIKDKDGNYLSYKSIAEQGDSVSAISRHVERDNYDLVVIGSTGIDDPSRWYYSTAAELINEINAPILIVPASGKPYQIKQIVYAAELVKDDAEAIKRLLQFASAINAWVTVLHIVTSENDEDANIFRSLRREVMQSSSYSNVSWQSVESKNVKKALTDFIKTDSIDLLSLLRYNRNGLDSLFHKSLAKGLIKVSPVPLLIVH